VASVPAARLVGDNAGYNITYTAMTMTLSYAP
jgi:hypothetical protein